MAYIGKKPAAAALTSSDIAADVITAAKIADDAISEEHLDATVVTGLTALGAEPADTDELIVSDAGTLKRMDYSYIKAGGVTEVDQWRLTTDLATAAAYITANWERIDGNLQDKLGTGMSESSGVFTFPSTGIWYVTFNTMFRGNGDGDVRKGYGEIAVTTNNSSYSSVALSSNGLNNHGLDYDFGGTTSTICDVTDTTNHKVKFYVSNSVGTGILTMGSSSYNKTFATFIKLADT